MGCGGFGGGGGGGGGGKSLFVSMRISLIGPLSLLMVDELLSIGLRRSDEDNVVVGGGGGGG